MYLIFEITGSAAGAMQPPPGCAVFTTAGGTIGRLETNEWVLPDRHVSGTHARIRSVGGIFFVEDADSANGVGVNGYRLCPGELFPLKNGDKVFIDPFEIVAGLSHARPEAASRDASPVRANKVVVGRHGSSQRGKTHAVPPVELNDLLSEDANQIVGEPASPASRDKATRAIVDDLIDALYGQAETRKALGLSPAPAGEPGGSSLNVAAYTEASIRGPLAGRTFDDLVTNAAFADALMEIRHHQRALLAGMRAGYEGMLRRLGPATLKEQLGPQGVLQDGRVQARDELWDAYERYYSNLTADAEHCFRALFGQDAGRAYEQELQSLREREQPDP